MQIFQNLKISLLLTRNSWHFLCSNKSLFFFPLLAALLNIVVIALAIPSVWACFNYNNIVGSSNIFMGIGLIILFLLAVSFITIFINTAATVYILQHMQGKPISAMQALRFAMRRWLRILQWSIINTIIAQILHMVENSNSRARNFIANAGGIAWSLASYFVIPLIVVDDLGPINALRASGKLFKQRWSRVVGVNVIVALLSSVIAILAFALVQYYLRSAGNVTTIMVVMGSVIVALFIIAGILFPLLKIVIRCALFQMLHDDKIPLGFSDQGLRAALIANRKY